MQKAEVPRKATAEAIAAMRTDRILPYRFITAARYAPDFEPELESAMLKSIKDYARLPGRTRLLIDVSGSMFSPLSAQSEMTRAEAACGLAILARQACDEVEIFTFSQEVVKVLRVGASHCAMQSSTRSRTARLFSARPRRKSTARAIA